MSSHNDISYDGKSDFATRKLDVYSKYLCSFLYLGPEIYYLSSRRNENNTKTLSEKYSNC